MSVPIYLDGFASLPLAPEARAAMIDALARPGNPASPHQGGERAARIIAGARTEIALLIGCSPSEIVFTSGATEANNLAILGAARAARGQRSNRNRILVSAIEHKAVLEPARALQAEGFEMLVAPVDRFGRLDVGAFGDLLDERILLASVMAVNNETGVVQPVREAAELARTAGALFHCDAAQAIGKIPIDVGAIEVDYMSISAHKMYGPAGVGALYVSASAMKPAPLVYGGGQQGGLRAGTEPAALIAGFGAAAKIAAQRMEVDAVHGRELAALLLSSLAERQVRYSLVTNDHDVVPGSLSVRLDGVDADHLCMLLADRVQLSTGSACTSGQLRTSHVLEQMGFSSSEAREVLRAFCHRYVDRGDVASAAAQITAAARKSAVATGEVLQ